MRCGLFAAVDAHYPRAASRAGAGSAGAGAAGAGLTGAGLAGAGAAGAGLAGAGDAVGALAAFGDPEFSRLVLDRTVAVPVAAPYQPGEFFRRELPVIQAVLAGLPGIGLLVIDGYADLDPRGRPGLGAHVHRECGVPVVGVAKSAFRTATHAVPVLRGRSARPLFVTAAGLPLPEAAALVGRMAGAYRLPGALRYVDRLARGAGRPWISPADGG